MKIISKIRNRYILKKHCSASSRAKYVTKKLLNDVDKKRKHEDVMIH